MGGRGFRESQHKGSDSNACKERSLPRRFSQVIVYNLNRLFEQLDKLEVTKQNVCSLTIYTVVLTSPDLSFQKKVKSTQGSLPFTEKFDRNQVFVYHRKMDSDIAVRQFWLAMSTSLQ